MPRGGRPLRSLWSRCRWEVDILRSYLEETATECLTPPSTSEPARVNQRVSQEEEPPARVDRRCWTRHPSNLRALCWLSGKAKREPWLANVRDISGGGIGLIVPYRPALGAILNLQLVSLNLVEQNPLQAEVMFVSQRAAGQWVLGCEFLTSLTAEQQEIYL
jgi:PilZ domain